MREITEVKTDVNSKVTTRIANLNETKEKIKVDGKNCEKYYF
jgi:hypothetical protein